MSVHYNWIGPEKLCWFKVWENDQDSDIHVAGVMDATLYYCTRQQEELKQHEDEIEELRRKLKEKEEAAQRARKDLNEIWQGRPIGVITELDFRVAC